MVRGPRGLRGWAWVRRCASGPAVLILLLPRSGGTLATALLEVGLSAGSAPVPARSSAAFYSLIRARHAAGFPSRCLLEAHQAWTAEEVGCLSYVATERPLLIPTPHPPPKKAVPFLGRKLCV